MVFFACNTCGASLKKNQVDKHAFQCRFSTISCMDCQKDFSIKEYGSHLKCISEVEKYSATGWKPPANFNKGEKKQQAWVDTVNATLKQGGNSLTPACRSLLQAMAKHDNVPRKKPKFLNFIRNVSKNRFDDRTIDSVWDLVEQQWKAQAASTQNEATSPGAANSNGDSSSGKENAGTSTTDDSNTISNKSGSQEDETAQENGEAKLSKREKKEARRQKQNKEEKKEKRKKTGVSEEELENVAESVAANANGSSNNGQNEDDRQKQSKKEKKKRKRTESCSESEKKKTKSDFDADADVTDVTTEGDNSHIQNDEESTRDFKWGQIIKDVLLKQPDHEISMKKLRKKIFAEYFAVVGDSKGNKSNEELISKLNKKLKKQQFKVLKDKVKLVE